MRGLGSASRYDSSSAHCAIPLCGLNTPLCPSLSSLQTDKKKKQSPTKTQPVFVQLLPVQLHCCWVQEGELQY